MNSKKNKGFINADNFDVLSAIWILACNDDNPIITYEGIKYRLDLDSDSDSHIRELVRSHPELFRQRVLKNRLDKWKQKVKKNPNICSWLRDIEDKKIQEKSIDELKPEDVFRSQFRVGEDDPKSDIKIIEWGLQHIDRLRKAQIEESEQKSKIRTPLVVALVTALFSFTASYLTFQLSINNQNKATLNQEKRKVYSELIGYKDLIRQTLASRFQALLYSDYHESKWMKSGFLKESLDLEEGRRWQIKSEELGEKLAIYRKDFYSTIGSIQTTFKSTNKLDQLLSPILNFRYPEFKTPLKNIHDKNLDEVKQQIVKELDEYINNEFSIPVDSLLFYLRNNIN